MKEEPIIVVWACAWCPKETWQPLKKNEEWTHGICVIHKEELYKEVKKRKKKKSLTFPS